MAKTQAVWALDIGQAALKALKLVPGDTPDSVIAEAFDFVEYPKILSQPDADPEALVAEALGTFLDRNDLKGSRVAIAVPGQAGLVKFIKLPPVEKKRIPDIVKFEAKQQIPFALEEVVWAYQQIGDKDEEGDDDDFTTVEVGLFAMKRDQINRAITPFKAAGIEIDIVQMGPIALYNYVTFDQLKGSGLKGSIVLLDIGADNTDLIISDGTRIWQRNVPIGGNHFTRALTKELKLTFAKAEHLKRNATKAPDPKAVFTAMKGIFNDFASEVNRSIGFYSSVNRTAQIIKVVGLGNGFKLPGLQKFLQQNLNGLEVEKLEDFVKLSGDEVKSAPQFVENLPSFAVTYGLALQGLAASQLRTNLLPPEVEQVRMIRRKKPWVLAAAALLMLAFTTLFLSDFKAYAKVVNEPFKVAVEKGKSVAKTGAEYASTYEAAKGEFQAKLAEGKALVVPEDSRAAWPKVLKVINDHMPNPAAEYHLDPNIPKDVKVLDRLRVHVDKIKPVYRTDLAVDWYNNIGEKFKALMHPLDRKDPPVGEGWIIQLLCHHYNPTTPIAGIKLPLAPGEMGPYNYIYKKVLPHFTGADLRALGIHHVAMTWFTIDDKWTADMGSGGSGLSSAATLLARASAPAAAGATGGAGGDGGMAGMMSSQMGRPSGGPGGGPGSGNEMGGGSRQFFASSAMGRGGMPGMGGAASADKQVVKLTRTDFLIQFVWQPPAADAPAKPVEEILKELRAAESDEKNKGAIAALDAAKTEQQLNEESVKGSKNLIQAEEAKAAKASAAAPAPAPAPGTTPVAPATPGVTPTAPGAAPVDPAAGTPSGAIPK